MNIYSELYNVMNRGVQPVDEMELLGFLESSGTFEIIDADG